jgi:hypothetical protein
VESDEIAQLWLHALKNWDQAAVHAALLQRCDSPGQLAEVAKLYREQTIDSTRHSVAEAQLARITALAIAQLEVPRVETPVPVPYAKYAAILFFVLGSVWLAAWL